MSLNEILIEFKAKAEGYKEQLRGIVNDQRQVEQSAKRAEDAMNNGFVTGAEGAKRFDREVKRNITTQAELELKLRNLNELLRDEAKIGTEAHRAIQREVAKTNKELEKTTGNTKKQTTAFENLGRQIAVAFSVGQLISFGKQVVDVTRKTELLQNQLNFVAGSTEGGDVLFRKLQEEAKRLGLDFEALSKGFAGFATSSKQAGFSAQQSLDIYLKLAAGIRGAGAGAEASQRAFYALEQMMSKGKVSSEELRRQLGDALPGSVAIAAKAVGVTTAEFNKMLETGQIISADFIPKFADAVLNEFAPSLSGKTNSLDAAINKANTAWQNFKRNLGDAETIKTAVNKVGQYLNKYNLILESNASGWEKAGRAFLDFITIGQANRRFFQEQSDLAEKQRQKDEERVKGIQREVDAVQNLSSEQRKAKKEELEGIIAVQERQAKQDKQNEVLLHTLETNKAVLGEINSIEQKLQQERDTNSEKRAKQDAARQKALEEYIRTINAAFKEEQMMFADLEAQGNSYLNSLRITAKYKAEQARQDQKDTDEFRKQQQDKLDAQIEASDKAFENDQKNLKKQQEAEKEALAQRRAAIQDFNSSVANLAQAIFAQETQRQRLETDARIRNLKMRFDAGLLGEQEYNKQVLAIQRQQFENEKRAARGQALINGALAITNILSRWAAVPPVAALLSGIAAATTAVQISAINQQTPGFKDGVIGLQGAGTSRSDSIPARLSKGESVMTAKETSKHRGLLEAIRADKADDYIRNRYILPELLQKGRAGFDDTGLRHDLKRLGRVSLKDETIDKLAGAISKKSTADSVMQRRTWR